MHYNIAALRANSVRQSFCLSRYVGERNALFCRFECVVGGERCFVNKQAGQPIQCVSWNCELVYVYQSSGVANGRG